jgi:hypothetical protein
MQSASCGSQRVLGQSTSLIRTSYSPERGPGLGLIATGGGEVLRNEFVVDTVPFFPVKSLNSGSTFTSVQEQTCTNWSRPNVGCTHKERYGKSCPRQHRCMICLNPPVGCDHATMSPESASCVQGVFAALQIVGIWFVPFQSVSNGRESPRWYVQKNRTNNSSNFANSPIEPSLRSPYRFFPLRLCPPWGFPTSLTYSKSSLTILPSLSCSTVLGLSPSLTVYFPFKPWY